MALLDERQEQGERPIEVRRLDVCGPVWSRVVGDPDVRGAPDEPRQRLASCPGAATGRLDRMAGSLKAPAQDASSASRSHSPATGSRGAD